ncbi:MAG: radical SAM protein [Deltaproteobacteria bacterium]|jgi:nitrogen fixation protein NifB|nr:radical SAM protein [Deltaproteobacteria bacterium]
METEKLKSHPCFGTQCQPTTGRIHLPVAKDCNIFCRFCARGESLGLNRPGQAARAISPAEAVSVVETALRLCPGLKVVGVAGPGDPLDSGEALDALTMVRVRFPGLMTCLSTNGLALCRNMERVMAAGVETITVTVNAVNPRILERLNRGVLMGKGGTPARFVGGLEGAGLLIDAQEKGIRLAHRNRMVVKVNCVLAPGINDGHVGEVAKTVKSWGADLLNVISLIPAGELAGLPAPGEADKARAMAAAEKHLPVKRNCRRCRADACGVPGLSDFSREIYGELGPAETFSHG